MTTVNLYPTDDAHVDSNNATTSYPSDTLMDVGDSIQYTYIRFDTSSIPTDATISAATFYYHLESNTGTTPLSFKSADEDIDESTLTWNNAPSESGGGSSGYISGTGLKNTPCLYILRDALVKDSNFIVFRIRNYINTESVEIRSKEYDNSCRLNIVYTAPTHYYVRASGGSDANDGLSWANGWATIDKAATTVADGAVVHIGFGNYSQTNADNITPINAGSTGIKYIPETAVTGGGTGEVVITLTT